MRTINSIFLLLIILLLAGSVRAETHYLDLDKCISVAKLKSIDMLSLKQDLSEMKATVQINEVDVSKIKTGLRVEIKPDAFSDSVYEGEVISVANLAVNKVADSKIKVFPVDILVKSPKVSLLPGLTVSCRIIVDKIDSVLYLPIDAVKSSPEGDYVFLKTATGFVKRAIKTGPHNTDLIIVENGLSADDKVALVDPFAQEVKEKKNDANVPGNDE